MATAAALVPPRAVMGLQKCRDGLLSPHARPKHCLRRSSECPLPPCDNPADCFVAPRAQRTRSSWGDCGGMWIPWPTTPVRVSHPYVYRTSRARRQLCLQVYAEGMPRPRISLFPRTIFATPWAAGGTCPCTGLAGIRNLRCL